MRFIAKWYTRASRVRIVIAKFDGKWTIPGGPYPIPELVAGVTGILATLFALPRLGNPVMTALVGIFATAILVGVMRTMPYSPVPFGTRVHRVMTLYASPISLVGGGYGGLPQSPVSIVRQTVTILDVIPQPTRRPDLAPATPAADLSDWGGLFDHSSPAPAAELFR